MPMPPSPTQNRHTEGFRQAMTDLARFLAMNAHAHTFQNPDIPPHLAFPIPPLFMGHANYQNPRPNSMGPTYYIAPQYAHYYVPPSGGNPVADDIAVAPGHPGLPVTINYGHPAGNFNTPGWFDVMDVQYATVLQNPTEPGEFATRVTTPGAMHAYEIHWEEWLFMWLLGDPEQWPFQPYPSVPPDNPLYADNQDENHLPPPAGILHQVQQHHHQERTTDTPIPPGPGEDAKWRALARSSTIAPNPLLLTPWHEVHNVPMINVNINITWNFGQHMETDDGDVLGAHGVAPTHHYVPNPDAAVGGMIPNPAGGNPPVWVNIHHLLNADGTAVIPAYDPPMTGGPPGWQPYLPNVGWAPTFPDYPHPFGTPPGAGGGASGGGGTSGGGGASGGGVDAADDGSAAKLEAAILKWSQECETLLAIEDSNPEGAGGAAGGSGAAGGGGASGGGEDDDDGGAMEDPNAPKGDKKRKRDDTTRRRLHNCFRYNVVLPHEIECKHLGGRPNLCAIAAQKSGDGNSYNMCRVVGVSDHANCAVSTHNTGIKGHLVNTHDLDTHCSGGAYKTISSCADVLSWRPGAPTSCDAFVSEETGLQCVPSIGETPCKDTSSERNLKLSDYMCVLSTEAPPRQYCNQLNPYECILNQTSDDQRCRYKSSYHDDTGKCEDVPRSCTQAMNYFCAGMNKVDCTNCTGKRQYQMKEAGCEHNDMLAFCAKI